MHAHQDQSHGGGDAGVDGDGAGFEGLADDFGGVFALADFDEEADHQTDLALEVGAAFEVEVVDQRAMVGHESGVLGLLQGENGSGGAAGG